MIEFICFSFIFVLTSSECVVEGVDAAGISKFIVENNLITRPLDISTSLADYLESKYTSCAVTKSCGAHLDANPIGVFCLDGPLSCYIPIPLMNLTCQKCVDITSPDVCEENILSCWWKNGKCEDTTCSRIYQRGAEVRKQKENGENTKTINPEVVENACRNRGCVYMSDYQWCSFFTTWELVITVMGSIVFVVTVIVAIVVCCVCYHKKKKTPRTIEVNDLAEKSASDVIVTTDNNSGSSVSDTGGSFSNNCSPFSNDSSPLPTKECAYRPTPHGRKAKVAEAESAGKEDDADEDVDGAGEFPTLESLARLQDLSSKSGAEEGGRGDPAPKKKEGRTLDDAASHSSSKKSLNVSNKVSTKSSVSRRSSSTMSLSGLSSSGLSSRRRLRRLSSSSTKSLPRLPSSAKSLPSLSSRLSKRRLPEKPTGEGEGKKGEEEEMQIQGREKEKVQSPAQAQAQGQAHAQAQKGANAETQAQMQTGAKTSGGAGAEAESEAEAETGAGAGKGTGIGTEAEVDAEQKKKKLVKGKRKGKKELKD